MLSSSYITRIGCRSDVPVLCLPLLFTQNMGSTLSTDYCVFIFHPVSEDEFQLSVLPNNHLINQRHESIRFKPHAFLLLLKHAKEHLNPPPAVSPILFLILDAADLLTE